MATTPIPFWKTAANVFGQYLGRSSPAASAVYGGITGKSPYGEENMEDPNNPNPPDRDKAVTDALFSGYKRMGQHRGRPPQNSAQPVQPKQPGSQAASQVQDEPNPVGLNPVTVKDTTPGEPSTEEALFTGQPPSTTNLNISLAKPTSYPVYGGIDAGNGPMGSPGTGGIIGGSWFDTYPSLGRSSGGGGDPVGGSTSTFTPEENWWNLPQPGGGGGSGWPTGNPGEDNLDGFARGGVAGHDQLAKVAESGPEMAGGRIISSPTIVKLNKGEVVIPLNSKATNKLQPDLLEGHVAAPNPQGVHYSRYKSYGQGRGLMR